MKRILTLVVALVAMVGMAFAESLTYKVTVPAGTKACYIAGSFNKWAIIEMTKVDDTHYTINVEGATSEDVYKYLSGPDWAYVEQTSTGGDVLNRTYAAEDVVAKWKAVYDPGTVATYSTFRVCIQYDKAPTIWWWGAGSKCPNPEVTKDPDNADGGNYVWPGPTMKPLAGAEGWYYWEFVDVDDALGVTFKIDENNIGERNAKKETAYTVMGVETTWPVIGGGTLIRNVYTGNKSAVKTMEKGKVVIVVDGEKFDVMGRKL